jgi:hypothetical protein
MRLAFTRFLVSDHVRQYRQYGIAAVPFRVRQTWPGAGYRGVCRLFSRPVYGRGLVVFRASQGGCPVKNANHLRSFFSLLVLATGVTLPPWLLKTAGMLGDFTIPLMLLTLGVSLAKLRVMDMKRALALSFLRLAIGFTAGLAVAWLLNLPWPARGVLILQSSMPVAVFNYLLAQRYNHFSTETAGVVVVSTVLALGTLPLLLQYLIP